MDEISFLEGFSNIIIRLFHVDFKKLWNPTKNIKLVSELG